MHYVDEKHCPVCSAPKTYREIAKKSAWRTAHELATKEAQKPDARFTPVQVYTLMFPIIYEHEYKRRAHVERERQDYKHKFEAAQLCSYHGEFDEEFSTNVMRRVEQKYSVTKWPNALEWSLQQTPAHVL
jgi:hypothetical protein